MDESQVVEEIIARTVAAIARDMRGIVPERVYPPDEAAELIGFRSVRRGKTLREIPAELLPPVPLTPGNGLWGYLGRDLIAYIEAQRMKANPQLRMSA